MSLDMTSARIGIGASGAGGPPLYEARGAHFDGTNDKIEGTGLTTADATRLVMSAWVRNTGGDGSARYVIHATGTRVYMQITSSDIVRIVGRNSSNSDIWRHDGPDLTGDSDWHHILAFMDCSGDGSSFVYVDGVDASNVTNETTGTINSGVTTWAIGSATGGALKANADIAEVWIGDPGREVVAADVKRFISGGRPQYLGAQGQAPFGSQPMFYLRGDHNGFGANSGSAGNLTVTGALTAAQRLYGV